MPWSVKYSPSSLSGIVGQDTARIRQHALSNPKGKALLIYGPAGCGKSSSVSALAREKGYELVQVDVSDIVNAETIRNVVGSASVTGSLFGKRIILVDDVDSFSSRDRGGITELIKCIRGTRTPIYLTAIDPWSPKLRTLRGYCNLVEFKGLKPSVIKDILRRICIKEGIKADDSVLYSIASHANGDVRAAINNLEMLGSDKEITKYELDAMGYREKPLSVIDGLRVLFKGNFNESLRSLDDVNMDVKEKLLWITENITNEYRDMKEIAAAFNWLSRADVFYGRIKGQYWRFLVYVNALMTAGVNSAGANNGFSRYFRPAKLLKLWRSKPKRELRKQAALKLQPAFKASISKITETLPFIKLLARKLDYGLTEDEIKALSR